MSKLVYLADLTHCDIITNVDTFPLGIGQVASYAKMNNDFLNIELFKYPHDLNDALNRKIPSLVSDDSVR